MASKSAEASATSRARPGASAWWAPQQPRATSSSAWVRSKKPFA